MGLGYQNVLLTEISIASVEFRVLDKSLHAHETMVYNY